MAKRFILSIDGGGIRGIIPSVFLAQLHKELQKQGLHKPLHQVFDLMAGTSTGGLIGLALSVPLYKSCDGVRYHENGGIEVEKLPGLYRELGAVIFPGSRHHIRKIARQMFASKYSRAPFHKVLIDLFNNCTVQQALTNLLITAFDMKSMHPVFIKKRPVFAGGAEDTDFYMADAAFATAAVPTFFPPAYVHAGNMDYCLIDGGIFCINPAMSAYVEARKVFPHDEYDIVSLGTGVKIEEYKTETIQHWGFFNWIAPWLGVPLISAAGEGQKISVNHMLKKLPRINLTRVDIELDRGKGAMDDGSTENLNYLEEKANEMLDTHRDVMNKLVHKIITEITIRNSCSQS